MDDSNRVSCVLCQRSEETKITGALSTKDDVTAHQNCLLFSSGIYCRNTPQFDDLFGFSVEDVLIEVKRGSKLMCSKCKMKGATAGCEVKRCKKSYHYPCAVQDRAKVVEDTEEGKYGLYCTKHDQQTQKNNGSVNGRPSSFNESPTSKSQSEAGPSKVYCLACEKTEGNISFESLSNSIVMLYCNKHAPASHKRNSSAAGRPSVHSSDSNSSSSGTPSCSKRPLDCSDKQEGTPSKRKAWNVILTDDSSNSGDNEPDSEMAIYAPIETDIDESANSVPEALFTRQDNESPTGSTSGNQLEDRSIDGNKDEDEDEKIQSDAESESLLSPVSHEVTMAVIPTMVLFKPESIGEGSSPDQSPVHSPAEHAAGPPVPQQSSAESPPSSSPAPPITICVSLLSPPSRPMAPPSEPEPSLDSSTFWKSCNAAGCTQALFTGFINEMNDISSRIQSDLASQEDYDLALSVMNASGKLAELVAKQQEELQRKQTELQKATAVIKEVSQR